jgi:hypothetical protein
MTLTRPAKTGPRDLQNGRYFHSDHQLYCVEERYGEHVLIEDCASGELLDIPISELRRMTPVRPRSAPLSRRREARRP